MGDYPAISDAGDLIVFAAEHPELGRGLFIADPETGRWTKFLGQSQDGHLDPNEIHRDLNENDQYDPGEDFGNIGPIDLDAHLGINRTVGPGGGVFHQVAFMANDAVDGRDGLYGAKLIADDSFPQVLDHALYLGDGRVASVGELLPGVGPVHALNTYDPINTGGQIAFWVESGADEAIVVAHAPISTWSEVLFAVEGHALSENKDPDGDPTAVARFVPSRSNPVAADFEAQIDWGDGQRSAGTIAVDPWFAYGFTVTGDHTYKREGPYVVTVGITDTRDDKGGFAGSLAYVFNAVDEEDIEREAEDKIIVDGGAIAPLSTLVRVDEGAGTFEVTSSGQAEYLYNIALDSVSNDGQGVPSAAHEGRSDIMDVKTIHVTGTFDPANYADFEVEHYDTKVSGDLTEKSSDSGAEVGDRFTSKAESMITYEDNKTYDDGEFDWTLHTTHQVQYEQHRTPARDARDAGPGRRAGPAEHRRAGYKTVQPGTVRRLHHRGH